jgi:hypothetical protein
MLNSIGNSAQLQINVDHHRIHKLYIYSTEALLEEHQAYRSPTAWLVMPLS